MELKKGDKVKILKKYKKYEWYSNNVYTIIDILNDVSVLNKNLENLNSSSIKTSLLFNIQEERIKKLKKLKKNEN